MANTVANVTIGALESLALAGTTVGYTGAPFTVNSESARTKFTPEQSFSPIISQMTDRTYTAGCQLWESTPENIAIVWSLPAAAIVTPSNKILSLSVSDRGNITISAVGKAGSAPGTSKTRTFYFAQAVPTGAVETQIAKSDVSRLNVSFDCLANSSGDVGVMTDTV